MEASQSLVHCLLSALDAVGHVPLLNITFSVSSHLPLAMPSRVTGPSSFSPLSLLSALPGQVQLPSQGLPVCQRLPCSLLNAQSCLHQTSLWRWQSLGQLTWSKLNQSNPCFAPKPTLLQVNSSSFPATCLLLPQPSSPEQTASPVGCTGAPIRNSAVLYEILLIFSTHYLLCLSSLSLWPGSRLCSNLNLTFQHLPKHFCLITRGKMAHFLREQGRARDGP